MSRFSDLLSSGRTIFLDGAMGSLLQKRGLPKGERSDLMNFRAPEAVEAIHRLYVEAGSDIILTNSLGANAHALNGTEYTPRGVIKAAIENARRAAGPETLVALDIGPVGILFEPVGDNPLETAYELFAEQVRAGAEFGADLIFIETMSDLAETTAAIRAARENSNLPVLAAMTFGKDGRTYLGVSPTEFAEAAEALGVAAVGLNCSSTPEFMLETAREFRAATSLPLIVKLNAGLPDADGEYSVTPEDYAAQLEPYRELGVRFLGSCCGSDERFIRQLKQNY
jgi:5-methyltetrahydrofolate--homocysteine methyltransferase